MMVCLCLVLVCCDEMRRFCSGSAFAFLLLLVIIVCCCCEGGPVYARTDDRWPDEGHRYFLFSSFLPVPPSITTAQVPNVGIQYEFLSSYDSSTLLPLSSPSIERVTTQNSIPDDPIYPVDLFQSRGEDLKRFCKGRTSHTRQRYLVVYRLTAASYNNLHSFMGLQWVSLLPKHSSFSD